MDISGCLNVDRIGKKFDFAILVLLYSCELDRSLTLTSISTSKVDLHGGCVCIWNNGPVTIDRFSPIIDDLVCTGLDVFFIETLENRPLSHIYNNFVGEFNASKFVFFDHDSQPESDYFRAVKSSSVEHVSLPLISAAGVDRSPTVSNKFNAGPYVSSDVVVGIGSGLVLGRRVVDRFLERYGSVFDWNFSLYGVDTTFFLRLHSLDINQHIVVLPKMSHSLSRLENESISIKSFRVIERSFDLGLTIRHYPSIKSFKYLLKECSLFLFGRSKLNLRVVFGSIFSGVHPNSIKRTLCLSHEFRFVGGQGE